MRYYISVQRDLSLHLHSELNDTTKMLVSLYAYVLSINPSPSPSALVIDTASFMLGCGLRR